MKLQLPVWRNLSLLCLLLTLTPFSGVLAQAPDVVISEIMYNPPESGTDSLEYIEFYNNEATAVSVGGWYLSEGVVFTFPSVSIPAGGYFVIAVDSMAMYNTFGVSAWEWTSGGLSNGGEDIVLKTTAGLTVDSVDFDDVAPWPLSADEGGHSLVLCDVSLNNNLGASWDTSYTMVAGQIINGMQLYGSPGAVDAVCGSAPVGVPGYPAYTIASVTTNDASGVADSLNVQCQLTGTIYSIDFDGNAGYSFYIYDNTGGINVFNFADNAHYTGVVEGDMVEVYGEIDQYNGLTEIVLDSIYIVSSGNTLATPATVSTLDETTEGEFIRMSGFMLVDASQWPAANSNANVQIYNGADTVVMRIDSDTDIDGSTAPTGTFDVIGAGSQFDGTSPYDEGYQIFPSKLADIIQTGVVGYPSYTIASVTTSDANGVADSLNVQCQLTGTIYTIDFDGNAGYSFYIYDNTGGINVFNFADNAHYTGVVEGDMVEVYGEIDQYNGLTEIILDSIYIVSTGNTLKTPMTASTLDESTEGEFIRMNGFQLADPTQWPASGSANVDIYNGGDTLTMRVDSDTDIDGSIAPTGMFDVIGAGSQFDGSSPYDEGYQIFPSKRADIIEYTSATGYPAYTIASVTTSDVNGVADSMNVSCRLDGVLYSTDFDGNAGYSFYIKDATGGINVYNGSDVNGYTNPQTGDALAVFGFITQYNGLTEIDVDSIYVKSTAGSVSAPMVVTTLDESTEGDHIRLNGYMLANPSQWPSAGNSANVDIYDANDTLTMRIDSDTDIDGTPAPTTAFDVIGAGSQFDNSNPYTDGYQIFPGSLTDIIPVIPTTPTISIATASSMEMEDVGTITVNVVVSPAATTAETVDLQFVLGANVTVPGDGIVTPAPNLTTGILTLNIPANEDTVSFDISVVDDAIMEGNETLFVDIATISSGLTMGTSTSYYLVIEDNDTPLPTYDIAPVKAVDANGIADSVGVEMRLHGVVFTDDFDGNAGLSFNIYDNTGGINIFNFNDVSNYVVTRGDSIAAMGTILMYNGLAELEVDSIRLIKQGVTLKTPTVVPVVSEATESEYIRINGVQLVDPSQWPTSPTGSTNLEIYTSTDTMTMRIDSDTDLNGSPAPVGTFDVVGTGGQFDGSSPYTEGYQIFPRDLNDIILILPKLAVTEIMPSSQMAVSGDWFEVTNYGNTPIDMDGFSWDDESQVAGTHTVTGTLVLAPGESVIFLDEVTPDDSTWLYLWMQAANNLNVIAADEFGPIGFSGLGSGGDEVNLYDNNGALIQRVAYDGTDVVAGYSIQVDTNGTVSPSVVGQDGVYTSAGTPGDAGNPGNMTPISIKEFTFADVSLYPNPVKDRLFVETNTTAKKVVTITTANGTVMSTVESNNTVLEINTSEFAKGLYIISIEMEGVIASRKIVVH